MSCCQNRQAYRLLRSLLGYDPTTVPMGEPGFGSCSGAPDLMFGFLKHLWAMHSKHDALLRSVAGFDGHEALAMKKQSIKSGL